MKKKVQQKSISQLVQDITSIVNDIENGASLKQLDKLQKHTQELNNRAIILQYKASEKFVKEDDDSIEISSDEFKTSEPNIKKKEVKAPNNQESLFSFQLDEEPTSNSEEVAITEEETMTFSPIEEESPEPITTSEPVVETPTITETEENLVEETESSDFGLPAKPIEEQVMTLADKLSAKKIESINGIMSVQEKMQFTNDLFDGDHVQFADAITRLDKAPDADQAKHLLSNLSRNFGWDLENKVAQHFIQLVERKFKA